MQLSQHEMRDKDLFAKKSSLGDVHDATVDDDARVEQYTRLYRAALDQTGPRAGRAEHKSHHLVSPVQSERHPPIGEDEGHNQRDDEAEIPGQLGQEQTNERRQQQPNQESYGRRHQIWQRRDIQLIFEPEEGLGRDVREPEEAEERAGQCRQHQHHRSQRVAVDFGFLDYE